MKKVFETHLHYIQKVPLRESVQLFKKCFALYNAQKYIFLSFPNNGQSKVNDLTQNVKGLYYKHAFNGDGYAYAGLEHHFLDKDADSNDFYNQIKEYHSVGFDGIKMYEGHPHMYKLSGYSLDDVVYDKFFDYAEKEGIPLTMHLGNDPSFWDKDKISDYWRYVRNCYFDETFPSIDKQYQDLFRVLDRHPNLKYTLAHFGFFSDKYDYAEKFMSYKNTMVDLTPGGNQIINMGNNHDLWKPFLKKYSHKIKFGCDNYNFYCGDEKEWEKTELLRPTLIKNFFETNTEHVYNNQTFKGIGADEEMISKIYFDNAQNELGSPKEIDLDYVINRAKSLQEVYSPDTLNGYDLKCIIDDIKK